MSNKRIHMRAKQGGFTLVEMMVAAIIGLLLLSGIITVFRGGIQSTNLNTAMSNLQASARYALDTITTDVRMASFQGCSNPDDVTVNINTSPAPTANFANTAIIGATITNTGWNPGTPANYTAPTANGVPVVGTDVLLVQYAESPGYPITTSMNNRGADIVVNPGASRFSLSANDFALISDCNSSDLFEVKTATGTTSKTLATEDALSKAYALKSATDTSVRVMPFINALYYIGDTGRDNSSGDNVFSLYRQTYPYTPATNPPIEMVEGVDQMQVQFGVRLANGSTAFVKPSDAAFDSTQVVSVRVGLLMTSNKRFPKWIQLEVMCSPTPPSVAPLPVPFDTLPTHGCAKLIL